MSLVSFGSDNHSGIHPQILEAMIEANQGYAPSYEQDEWSQQLKKIIKTQFDALDSALVFNGTAANVICLQMGLESYESVLVAESSHLNIDECGAPEKIAGVKLIPLKTIQGKIDFDEVENHLIRRGDQHFSQVKMISLTQPTEYGTTYSFLELQRARKICDSFGLLLHMDGARLANAASHLQCELIDLSRYFDLISFGGAKNGLMLGEFVIVRNPHLKKSLRHLRKQSLQLPAKTRFLTAPFIKYLDTPLHKEIADHENQMASLLHLKLKEIPQIQITQPTQSNAVFCQMPEAIIKTLKKDFFFYIWNEKTFEARLMTSFQTTEDEINRFILRMRELLN